MMLVDVLAKSGEAAKSGPIGLAIILILCVACYFLFKSMSKHLKTVREQYPTPTDETTPAPPQAEPPGMAETAETTEKAESTGQE
jgi:hypothetical protein